MDLQDAGSTTRYLIRDGKYPALFDAVLADSGITAVPSGVQMPRINAIMQRWVRTCRRELLDRTLICNQLHLLYTAAEPACTRFSVPAAKCQLTPCATVLAPYTLRPLPKPITDPTAITQLRIHRLDRLGGLLHEYQHVA